MATKTDLDLVQEAYELQFGVVYKVFADAYLAAKTPTDQDTAVAKFRAGVKSARGVRDVAKNSLP